MQLTFLYLLQRKEPIDDEDGDIESFGKKAELAVNIDDPLDQESSASVFDLSGRLNLVEVFSIDLHEILFNADVFVDISGEFSHHLRVSDLELICENHIFADLLSVGC